MCVRKKVCVQGSFIRMTSSASRARCSRRGGSCESSHLHSLDWPRPLISFDHHTAAAITFLESLLNNGHDCAVLAGSCARWLLGGARPAPVQCSAVHCSRLDPACLPACLPGHGGVVGASNSLRIGPSRSFGRLRRRLARTCYWGCVPLVSSKPWTCSSPS